MGRPQPWEDRSNTIWLNGGWKTAATTDPPEALAGMGRGSRVLWWHEPRRSCHRRVPTSNLPGGRRLPCHSGCDVNIQGSDAACGHLARAVTLVGLLEVEARVEVPAMLEGRHCGRPLEVGIRGALRELSPGLQPPT